MSKTGANQSAISTDLPSTPSTVLCLCLCQFLLLLRFFFFGGLFFCLFASNQLHAAFTPSSLEKKDNKGGSTVAFSKCKWQTCHSKTYFPIRHSSSGGQRQTFDHLIYYLHIIDTFIQVDLRLTHQ